MLSNCLHYICLNEFPYHISNIKMFISLKEQHNHQKHTKNNNLEKEKEQPLPQKRQLIQPPHIQLKQTDKLIVELKQPVKQQIKPKKSTKKQPEPQVYIPTIDVKFTNNCPYPQFAQQLEDSLKLINTFDLAEIIKAKKYKQDRIYYGVLQARIKFNSRIFYEVQNVAIREQTQNMFTSLHLNLMSDIWDGAYEIKYKEKPSKDQIIYGAYKANQIRMAESIIKDKLSNLNEQLQIIPNSTQYSQNSQRFNSHKKFSLDSEQTKKAEQFVKKIRRQQDENHIRCRQKLQQERQAQIKSMYQIQQVKSQIKEDKIFQIRNKLTQKARKRQAQKQKRQKMNSQYIKFISTYKKKKPLHVQYEDKFHKKWIIQQNMRRIQALKQVAQKKRSVSRNQIYDHIKKYEQLKNQYQQERSEAMQIMQDNIYMNQKQYYKGKFHSSILSQTMTNKTTIDDQRKSIAQQLYTRKMDYATGIKQRFMPKIDLQKQKALQQLISDLKPHRKDQNLPADQSRQQGVKNLQKFHQMIDQLRARGKIKNNSKASIQEPMQSVKKSRYVNYLDDIKSNRSQNISRITSSQYKTLNYQKIGQKGEQFLQIKARQLQQQADKKSLYLKHATTMQLNQHMLKKEQVQNDYLQSAKAKLAVLKKYKMQE